MIGVTGVILIVALGAGAQSLVLGQVTKLGSNLVGILPGKSNSNGPPAAVFGINVTTLNLDDVRAIEDPLRFPAVDSATGYVRGTAKAVWQGLESDVNFTGTESKVTQIQNMPIEKGRFFSDSESSAGKNVAVLGKSVEEELFGGLVDPIGQIVKIKNVPFEVVGVLEKQGTVAFQNQDDQVYIPLQIAQEQLLGIKHLQFARVKIKDSDLVKPTISEIERALRERHNIDNPENDDFSVRDLADAITLLKGITGALSLFLSLMAAISLLVGGVGIMNIMLVTVSERTREIGLRKAVGATKSSIRLQFLFESALLTLIGGLAGILTGTFFAYIVSLVANALGYEWAFVVSPISIILAVGVSIITGLVFGLYPAFKASKLDPIEALRYE
jgi:putative ABC transport system permease protein